MPILRSVGNPRVVRGAVGAVLFLLLAASLTLGPALSASAGPAQGKEGDAKKVDPAAEFANNPTLMFRVALRFAQRGLYTRTIPLLESFVRTFPNRAEHRRAVYLLADAYFFLSKTGAFTEYDNSIKAYLLALSLYPQAPQMPSAYYRLGQAYKLKGKPAEAQVAFRTLLERAPESPQAPQAQLEIAERYIKLQDPKSAIIEFSKILKKYRGSSAEKDAHFGIANALFAQRLFPDALGQFESGRKRWPDFLRLRPNFLFNYGETLFQIRRFTDAGRSFLRMVNVSPTSEFSHKALARMGDIQLEMGRPGDAIKIYARVISTYPKTEGAWVSLIRIADIGVEGKYRPPVGWVFPNDALRNPMRAYLRVLQEAGKSRLAEVAFLRIAAFYLKNGDLRKAIEAIRNFRKRSPESPLANNANIILARSFFEEIHKFYRREQFLRAVRSYGEYRTLIPGRVSIEAKPFKAMAEVGESYMRLGLYKEANEVFEKILGDPRGIISAGGEAIFRLAQSALLSGDRERAKEMARNFVSRFPTGRRSASIKAILGEIAWLEKRPRQAVALLTDALKEDLDNELRARSLFVLAEANAEIFHYAESVEALRKAIALYPKVPGNVKPFSLELANYRLGDMLYEGRRWIGSLVAYMGAVEAFPKSKLAGWAYHRIGKIQGQLKLVGRLRAPKKPKVSDKFWSDITKFRSQSTEWEKKNRSRLDKLKRESAQNLSGS
ncbi:tetratricopeptide repeat protein [Nitrospinota bacterium]